MPPESAHNRSRSRARSALVGTLLGSLSLLLPGTRPAIGAAEISAGGDFIRVIGEPWKIGEARSYTLQFDHAPFGRETIRLESQEGEGDTRQLRFTETLVLDLRALGQEGTLLRYSTVEYARGRIARAFRSEEILRKHPEYSTYARSSDSETVRLLRLDLETDPPRLWRSERGTVRGTVLAPARPAALVDPLSMGHWERLFLDGTWRVGDSRDLDLLLPFGLFRFDFHLDARRTDTPPERRAVTMRVEAREPVEVFSVPIPAFRCRIPELNTVLWVSASGGILRLEDRRGLVVTLER
jgi:hypothetical protein